MQNRCIYYTLLLNSQGLTRKRRSISAGTIHDKQEKALAILLGAVNLLDFEEEIFKQTISRCIEIIALYRQSIESIKGEPAEEENKKQRIEEIECKMKKIIPDELACFFEMRSIMFDSDESESESDHEGDNEQIDQNYEDNKENRDGLSESFLSPRPKKIKVTKNPGPDENRTNILNIR